MKALSIKQPWLWAITNLDKRIENRTWKPPLWIIGQRIALHASKQYDNAGRMAIKEICGTIPLAKYELSLGYIVATAKITGWVNERGFGTGLGLFLPSTLIDDKWFFGPIGWILEDVQLLDEPIPCKGALRLWNVPQEIAQVIEKAG